MKGRKSVMIWLAIVILVTPFVAYGLSSFVPQYDSFIVTSGSMEPEIQTGSLLFTVRTSPEKISVGDTITFQEDGAYTTHKVIDKNSSSTGSTFRTQGIANSSPDPGKLTEDQIVGKKLFSLPFLGYFIVWTGTTTGLILLVLIPGVVLIVIEARKITRELSDISES